MENTKQNIKNDYDPSEGVRTLPKGLNKYYESLFSSEDKREIGLDTYDAIFDSPLLFPLQRRFETAYMMQQARVIKPKVVYEIGAAKGGGLYHWCKSIPTVERVIACELHGIPYAPLFEKAFPHIDFFWLPKSSWDPSNVSQIAEWLEADKIDCLFIDGDKTHFDVDFWSYLPHMNKNGIVFMHDIQGGTTRAGFNRVIKKGYRHKLYVNTEESKEAIIREKRGIEPSTSHEKWLRHWHGRSAGVGTIFIDGKIQK